MKPRLLLTQGDVAGIGPEILARAWPDLLAHGDPVIVGDPDWQRYALKLVGSTARVEVITEPEAGRPTADVVPVVRTTEQKLDAVQVGQIDGRAGRAAYDFLCAAIDWTKAGRADAIVTAPLHKEGLHAGGVHYPGHTEILADRCGVKNFAMVLALGNLAVVHVTLHMALRDVFQHLNPEAIRDKAHLLDGLLTRLLSRRPRLAVAALNPHASDGGLFGDEEATIIAPAVERARAEGLDVTGPWPTDTLFARAHRGAYDGVVAMYHDQGHIALKLLGMKEAVNISVGLPIVRTSVAHGTAYDIAGKGQADARSLVEAARIAARLAISPAK